MDEDEIEFEEIIKDFFEQIKQIQNYWCSISNDPKKVAHGVIFSFLVVLDGCSGSFDHQCDLLINGKSICEKIGMLHDRMDRYE